MDFMIESSSCSTAKEAAGTQPQSGAALSIRTDGSNLNHHLWWNRGTWWLHCTLHYSNYTKQRIRRSLRTKALAVARQRRDAFFTQFKDTTSLQIRWSSKRFSVPIKMRAGVQRASPVTNGNSEEAM
jgi:hypothetical protein